MFISFIIIVQTYSHRNIAVFFSIIMLNQVHFGLFQSILVFLGTTKMLGATSHNISACMIIVPNNYKRSYLMIDKRFNFMKLSFEFVLNPHRTAPIAKQHNSVCRVFSLEYYRHQ